MTFLANWATYWMEGGLARGFTNTMAAFVVASLLTILWGLIVAVLRISPLAPVRFVAIAYIELFRGTPLLVQLLTFFAAIPIVSGLQLPPFETAVLALTLNAGGYLAESYRSGLQAVPRGQIEAGLAIGMSKALVFFRIAVPLAVRVILPAVGNTLAGLLLTTSFVFVVGLEDMAAKANQIMNRTGDWSVFLFITLIYVALGLLLLAGNNRMERRYRPLT
jgi:His/Glu/Gln/Arg/opine family amino acid ABC transporter permease subunit